MSLHSNLQNAYNQADAAVATSQGAAQGYDLGVKENAIAATITGLKEHVTQQKQMIQAGLNPDGTLMTQAERMQASRNLESDTNRTVAMTAATMREQAQKTMADLKNTVASFQMGAANMKSQGAGLEAQLGTEIGRQGLAAEQLRLAGGQMAVGARQFETQTGLSVNEQRLQSQAGIRQSQQMVAGLTDLMNQLRMGSRLTAFQAEMGGRNELFNQIQSNPESVISILPTLLMLGQVGAAPGGRTMAGFDFGSLA
jgi:hypothetical protein